jgi:hypothetical protein
MPHRVERLANGGSEIVVDKELELECYVTNKLVGGLEFML